MMRSPKRLIGRIGKQPSQAVQTTASAVEPSLIGRCETCRFNQRSSVYSTGAHLVVHCSNPRGPTYASSHFKDGRDCHFWEPAPVPPMQGPRLCDDCHHNNGLYSYPNGVSNQAVRCAVNGQQLIHYATECRFHITRQQHIENEEDAVVRANLAVAGQEVLTPTKVARSVGDFIAPITQEIVFYISLTIAAAADIVTFIYKFIDKAIRPRK